MIKTTWVSKVLHIGALTLGSLAFVTALAFASTRPAATPPAPVTTAAAAPLDVSGPLGATCASKEGQVCNFEGSIIHCLTQNGGRGQCLCFEHTWSCNF